MYSINLKVYRTDKSTNKKNTANVEICSVFLRTIFHEYYNK